MCAPQRACTISCAVARIAAQYVFASGAGVRARDPSRWTGITRDVFPYRPAARRVTVSVYLAGFTVMVILLGIDGILFLLNGFSGSHVVDCRQFLAL
jgi:hypothetical protein